MHRLLKTVLAIAGAATLGLPLLFAPPSKPAQAAQIVLCAPQVAEAVVGPRQLGGPLSSLPSGSVYSLNPQGCVVVQQADVPIFISQGFTVGPPLGANILFTTGVATGTTSFQVGTLPAASFIQHIFFSNSTANATAGIGVGTTSGGTDVVANQACGANCLVFITDATLLKRIFSTTASQPIFVSGLSTGWNSANVTVTIAWGYF